MRILKKGTWFIFFGLLAGSCMEQPDCYQLDNNTIGIVFRVLGTNNSESINISEISIDGTGVFYRDTTLSSFLLPLNYLTTETGVSIDGQGVTGTMLLKYTSQIKFVSDECGPSQILSDLSIVNSAGFDSVHVLNSAFGNPPYINIEVYRCPTTNLVKFDFYQLYYSSPTRKASQLMTRSISNIDAVYSAEKYYLDSTTNTVTLPIDLGANSSEFTMNFGGEDYPISVNYLRKEETRFRVCPNQTFVSDLTVSSIKFDSVSIAVTNKKPANVPTDPASTNVLIFQCPTTNLMQVAFKTAKGQSYTPVNITFVGIKNNFSPAILYQDTTVTSVVLPLNEASTNADYYFETKDKEGNTSIDTLTINYQTQLKTLFNACQEQKLYKKLLVSSPDIKKINIVVQKDSIQFPVITNVEIIKD